MTEKIVRETTTLEIKIIYR